MDKNEEKTVKAYEVVEKSAQLPEPKRALFGAKCPKCGGKLSKDTIKATVFSGEGGSDFAKKVIEKAGLPLGLYNLTIDRYTCRQGDYDYARAEVEPPQDPGA